MTTHVLPVAIGLVGSLAMACTSAQIGPTNPTPTASLAVIVAEFGERAPDPPGVGDVPSGGIAFTGPHEAEVLFRSQCLDPSTVPMRMTKPTPPLPRSSGTVFRCD